MIFNSERKRKKNYIMVFNGGFDCAYLGGYFIAILCAPKRFGVCAEGFRRLLVTRNRFIVFVPVFILGYVYTARKRGNGRL